MTSSPDPMPAVPRETLEVDVLCVGGGVAGLATAIHLLRRARATPGRPPPSVLVMEKSAELGSHVLSGAILDTGPLARLVGEADLLTMPVAARVAQEKVYYLRRGAALALPVVPPPMHALGLPLVSLGQVTAWLGGLAEKEGAEIITGMAVADLIEENGRVVGAIAGDMGRDKQGRPKPGFQPGAEIRAKAVVLAEGGHGRVTQQLAARRGLARNANEQSYALGIKELIEVPRVPGAAGRVLHTFGYPLGYYEYGGGFVYWFSDTLVAVSLVVGLDYRDPRLNPHQLFRAFKAHPLVHGMIQGGTVKAYGAKVLPEGGAWAAGELVAPGALIVGDAAGLLDAVRLKGAHLAVESGMAAAEALYACWAADDWSAARLDQYPARLYASEPWRRWRRFRNVRPLFQWGQVPGIMAIGASFLTAGVLPPGRFRSHPDHLADPLADCPRPRPDLPGPSEKELNLDILTDIYHSGTEHEEDQPCHLVIREPARCTAGCFAKFGAPCTIFCPAQVYEYNEERTAIRISPSNCLHCKTCTIKCPLGNIEWRLPEGGGGPRYQGM